MGMNYELLRYRNEIKQLQKSQCDNDCNNAVIVCFGKRSEDDMKRLAGYPAFAEALEALGGEHTEENIRLACKTSGLSVSSVYFEDFTLNEERYEEYRIPLRYTKNRVVERKKKMR